MTEIRLVALKSSWRGTARQSVQTGTEFRGRLSLLFKPKTLVKISSDYSDEKLYEEVARELQEKPMVPGLWTKAFAEMGGDDAKARALYIKYRF